MTIKFDVYPFAKRFRLCILVNEQNVGHMILNPYEYKTFKHFMLHYVGVNENIQIMFNNV